MDYPPFRLGLRTDYADSYPINPSIGKGAARKERVLSTINKVIPFKRASTKEANLAEKEIVKLTTSETHSLKIQCIGKVRGALFPPEYDLIRFIKGVVNPHPSWREDTPISQWKGVECNPQGEVIKIDWSCEGLKGVMDWKFLPHSLISLTLGSLWFSKNSLEGEIDFYSLPESLEVLMIGGNQFTGNFVVNALPKRIRHLGLAGNRFVGYMDVTVWPEQLISIDLSSNFELKGRIKKSKLPCSTTLFCENTQINLY